MAHDAVRHRSARAERGSAMIVVLVIMVALLSGGAIAIYLQVSDTKTAGLIQQSRDSLFCAEAGLAASRETIGANALLWPQMLDQDPDNDPSWYPIKGDLDGDNASDYFVIIRDNDDEFPGVNNDRSQDTDGRVFIVSQCTKYPQMPREVMELAVFVKGGYNYNNQSGQGAGNSGNANN